MPYRFSSVATVDRMVISKRLQEQEGEKEYTEEESPKRLSSSVYSFIRILFVK